MDNSSLLKKNRFKINGLNSKSLGVILSLISFFIFAAVLKKTTSGIYKYIFLLPFMFALINIIFINIYNKLTLITFIVVFVEFVRYVITPLILMIEGYPKGLYTYVYDENIIYNTTLIMMIEIIIIYSVLYIFRNYSNTKINEKAFFMKIMRNENCASFSFFSFVIVSFTIFLFLIFPDCKNIYHFIFLDDLSNNIINNLDSLPKGIGWLANLLGDMSKCIISEYMIIRFYKKYNKKQNLKYIVFSVLFILINALFVTSSLVVSMLPSVVFLFQVYIFYPKYRKLFLIFGFTMGIGVFIIIIFNHIGTALTYHSFSQMIQDYTNGYYCIYQAQCAYLHVDLGFLDKIQMLFIGDGIANISPFNIFFNTVNSSNIYNYYLYGMKFNGGAVLPFVSQWVYYFTPIIGPLFSSIPIILAKTLEKKWYNCNGNFLFSGIASLVFALAPFMYNMPTIIHIFTIFVIPLWITLKINSKIILK